MDIREVATDHRDLNLLVKKLDLFFDEKWGQSTAKKYQEFHQLSKMAYAVVCYVDNQPAGCGCYKVINENTVEIKRMYVDERYRRQGIASQILRTLETHAYKQGYRVFELETGKDMLDNIKMYEKCGYQIVENFDQFINDEICVCMKKRLI